MRRKIELLAPAKDLLSARIAIDAGADAIYMGGARFGARVAAANSCDQIAQAVEYAHQFGAKVYTTLNTLLFDDELDDAQKQARELIDLGVDALIVQDMALRRMDLNVELHASTQVNNMTAEGAEFLYRAGFSRVILERGLSMEQIRKICSSTKAEIECFIHGAICVGYSGRCFLSRSMSPSRSGNRGACSQPCRLSYDLVDSQGRKIITAKHLLSPRDMNLTSYLGEMLDAGVSSFKIEGRLKDATYLRNVVSWYRAALDQELKLRPNLQRASVGISTTDFTADPAKSFTRGFTDFLMSGKRAGVASFDTPKAVGEFVGNIIRCDAKSITLDRDHSLTAGDGICYGIGGTNVNRVEGRRIIPNRIEGFKVGQSLYRNFDSQFTRSVERSRQRRLIPTTAHLTITSKGLTLRYTDCEGVSATEELRGSFAQAEAKERMLSTIEQQLRKSGDTIFRVDSVEVEGEILFVPSSQLGELRRLTLQKLLDKRKSIKPKQIIMAERMDAQYPKRSLEPQDNVTNRLARQFYLDHGVEEIAPALELESSTIGHQVMRSGYCIRREIGQCLKHNPSLKGDLYIEHGSKRYLLKMDCQRCEMSLIDFSKR